MKIKFYSRSQHYLLTLREHPWDVDPPWSMLDRTPEGRGTDQYPRLDYGRKD
jgi:hypothetical protein